MGEWLLHTLNTFISQYTYFVVGYFVAVNSVYLLLIIFSFFHIRRQVQEKNVFRMHGLFASNLYNPISILAPAYNEEATVVASVHSLLQLRFPNYEVIVINDGSKDQTLSVLQQEFHLERVERYVPLVLEHKPIRGIYRSKRFPELIVVDKENGRKADALNAGVNVCRNDLFCAIDADCVLEPDVLQNMLRTFIEDETTIAVGGIVRVANNCVIEGNEIKEIRIPKSHLARIQVVEYLRAFLFGRVGWDYMDSLLIISGAFGIFDRNAVIRVGGYLHDTVGEDMELVVRLHRFHRENKIPYRVRFLPEPVCWTEVPEDINVLARQRNRWHRGLADTIWRHRKMLFNPKYGRLGMFAMPFFLIFELLAPVVELIGYLIVILMLIFGLFTGTYAILIFAAAVLLGMVLSVASVLCEEFTFRRYPKIKDVLIMSAYAFLENFGFRQIHSWWRLKGLIDFLRGNKEWGTMTRKGFGTPAAATASPAPVETQTQSTVTDGNLLAVSNGVPDKNVHSKHHEPVGDVVENMDVYREKSAHIKVKYKPKPDNRKNIIDEDNEAYANAYVRRSWVKTLLPVMVLFGSIATLAVWIFLASPAELSVQWSSDSIIDGFSVQVTVPDDLDDGLLSLITGRRSADRSSLPADEIISWDTPNTYSIAVHSFFSDQRASLAMDARDALQRAGYSVTMSANSFVNRRNIYWQVGIGEFSTYNEARVMISEIPFSRENTTIIQPGIRDFNVFAPTIDLDTSRSVYFIELGAYTSQQAQQRALQQWEEIGFRHLEAEHDGTSIYTVTTGAYNNLREVELLVELLRKQSGRNDIYIRVR